MKPKEGLRVLFLAFFASSTASAFAEEISGLSEEALFHRCYAHLTGVRAPP